jgi:hypothetical protein
MNPLRKIAIAFLIPFSLLSSYAMWQVGYIGIFAHLLDGPAGWQVFADLVIALTLVMCWMVPDAKANGRTVWPWFLLTLGSGSFGPLLYLLSAPKAQEQAA